MIVCYVMVSKVSAIGILKLRKGFIEEWFEKVDENKDMVLSLLEYSKMLPELDARFLGNRLGVKEASKYLLEYFRSFDINQDSRVDFEEFKAGVDQHIKRFKSEKAAASAKGAL